MNTRKLIGPNCKDAFQAMLAALAAFAGRHWKFSCIFVCFDSIMLHAVAASLAVAAGDCVPPAALSLNGTCVLCGPGSYLASTLVGEVYDYYCDRCPAGFVCTGTLPFLATEAACWLGAACVQLARALQVVTLHRALVMQMHLCTARLARLVGAELVLCCLLPLHSALSASLQRRHLSLAGITRSLAHFKMECIKLLNSFVKQASSVRMRACADRVLVVGLAIPPAARLLHAQTPALVASSAHQEQCPLLAVRIRLLFVLLAPKHRNLHRLVSTRWYRPWMRNCLALRVHTALMDCK